MASNRDWDPETVFEVMGSELARRILALAETKPCSAEELAAHCEASQPTIYRRLNVLQEYDLVTERRAIDDDGNHYKTYETTLESIRFEVEDGGFEVDLQLRRETVAEETDLDVVDHTGVNESEGERQLSRDSAAEGERPPSPDGAAEDGTDP